MSDTCGELAVSAASTRRTRCVQVCAGCGGGEGSGVEIGDGDVGWGEEWGAGDVVRGDGDWGWRLVGLRSWLELDLRRVTARGRPWTTTAPRPRPSRLMARRGLRNVVREANSLGHARRRPDLPGVRDLGRRAQGPVHARWPAVDPDADGQRSGLEDVDSEPGPSQRMLPLAPSQEGEHPQPSATPTFLASKDD